MPRGSKRRDIPKQGERRCSSCRAVKRYDLVGPGSEFRRRTKTLDDGTVRVYPDSWCCECRRRYNRKKWPGYRRRRDRQRRAEARAHRMTRRVAKGPLLSWLDEWQAITGQGDAAVARLTGLHLRQIYRVRHEQERVTLATVDAFVTGLEMPQKLAELYPLD